MPLRRSALREELRRALAEVLGAGADGVEVATSKDLQQAIEDGYEVKTIRKTRWKLPLVRDSHVAQLLYDGGKVIDQQIRGRSVKNAHLYESRYEPEAADAAAAA